MRPLALMTALILMAGCSQPSAPTAPAAPTPGASADGAAGTPAGDGTSAIVPSIDYPAGAIPEAAANPSPAGPTPAPVNESPVPTTTGENTLMLNREVRTLSGGVLNMTQTALNQLNDQLLFHYGTSPDELAQGKAGASIQVAIRLMSNNVKQFRQADIVSATVTYMELDDKGTYSEWSGSFFRGQGDSTLSFDVNAADSKISFTAKGLLQTDGGWGAAVSQRLVDWTVKGADMTLVAPATTAPATQTSGVDFRW